MAFEENKHPRDKDGKFTSKGSNYRQNTSYDEIRKSDNEKSKKLEDKYNSELPSVGVKKSLIKARKSLNKQIVKHTDKINNPQKYIPDWNNKPERYKVGIIKYWEKEIINFKNQIDKLGE